MLEKKISNLSTTLIINSYECFPIQTDSNKSTSYNLIKEKYDATELISISRAISVLIGTEMSAEQVAKKAIEVAAEICVFTNNNVKIEKI